MSDTRTLEIPTEDLEIGMYVAELDRPWLETPFLFQGFYIRNQEDIDELRRYCERVYIDAPKSAEAAVPTRRLNGRAHVHTDREKKKEPAPAARPARGKTRRTEPADTCRVAPAYTDTVTLKDELPAAKQAHQTASATIVGVMDGLRAGRKLDVPALRGVVEPMIDSVLRNHDAMVWLTRMRKKDDYIYNHSIASSVWAIVFGRHLGLDKALLHEVALGAMLLDVGKTRIPTELLVKPGNLSEEEEKLMRKHVEVGVGILERTKGIDPHVLTMVANHHERHNGTGYPIGLKGNDIPVYGRIAGVVDTYDAMTTNRPYAKAVSPYDAMRKLTDLSDVEFQAEMVEQFIQAVGIFPTGTLVEMNTGEVAIVVAQNRERRLRPKIMMILDRDKQLRKDFTVVDLRTQTVDQDNAESLWITNGLEPGAHGIDPMEYYLG